MSSAVLCGWNVHTAPTRTYGPPGQPAPLPQPPPMSPTLHARDPVSVPPYEARVRGARRDVAQRAGEADGLLRGSVDAGPGW